MAAMMPGAAGAAAAALLKAAVDAAEAAGAVFVSASEMRAFLPSLRNSTSRSRHALLGSSEILSEMRLRHASVCTAPTVVGTPRMRRTASPSW